MNNNDVSAAVNEYLNQKEPSDERFALRASLGATIGSQPDYEAEMQQLSAKTGVPLETAKAMPEETKTQAKIDSINYDELTADFPLTSKFLSDPKNASVSHDDIGAMKILENGWKSFKGGIKKGSVQEELGELSFNDLLGISTPEQTARRQKLKADMALIDEGMKDDSGLSYFTGQTGYAGRQVITSLKGGAKGAVLGAGTGATAALIAGQLGPQVATPEEVLTVPSAAIMGARVGFKGGALIQGFKMEAGFAWDEFKDLKTENGQPIDPMVAKGAAYAVGAVNSALEFIALDKLIKIIPYADKILSTGGKEAVKKLLKTETGRQALASFGKRWIGAITTEGITEGLQELSVIIGGELTKVGSGDELRAPTMEGVTDATGRALEAGLDAAAGAAGLGLAGGLGNRVGTTVKDRIEARKVEQNQTLIRALGEAGTESKLAQRMPEKYQELIKTIREGGPVENVFIPAEQFNSYFQSKGVDPSIVAQEVGATNHKEATAAGTDVMIPVEKYAATLARTEHHDALAEDIRFNQSEKTMREYAESLLEQREQEKKLQELAQQEIKTEEGIKQAESIKAQFVQNLVDVGTDRATAEAYATSYSKAIVNLAERSGMDPMVLAEKYGLSVSRPLPGVLTQDTRSDITLDPLLDMLRAGKGPTDREVYGMNLIDFIKEKGGINPELGGRGELASFDEGKKGFARISNKQSKYSLDSMAEAAVEAGYFPDKSYGKDSMSEAEMLDAIAQGESIYSAANTNYNLEDYRNQLEALQKQLSSLGIDLSVITDNPTVRKLIERAMENMKESNPSVYEFWQFAGRKSEMAPVQKLPRAVQMLNAGKGMEEIRKETGWFMGQDKRWRYEISDENAKIKEGVKFGGAKTYRLEQILDHNELFKAYPELRNLKVSLKVSRGRKAGTYDRSNKTLTIYVNKVLKPELQAFEDERQNLMETPEFKELARKWGSTTSRVIRQSLYSAFKETAIGSRYDELNKMLDKVENEREIPKTLPESNLSTVLHEVQHAIQHIEGFANGASSGKSMSSYKKYLDTHGEVEARDVEARKKMTDEERAAAPPAVTTYKNPIVRWDSVVKELPIEELPEPVLQQIKFGEQMTLFQGAQNLPDTVEVKGVQRPTMNSEGRPIARTEREIQNFYQWFGDSKVVDEQGRPLVVYHGTRPGNDITEFQAPNERDGIYFTPDPQYAESFTQELFGSSGAQGQMYAGYLSLQNPYTVNTTFGSEEADQFLNRGLDRKDLEAQGYDGAILFLDGQMDQAIAFQPGEVKSATGNAGTFDPNNPSILNQGEDNRGFIQIGKDRKMNIALLEKADLSTMLHELGHFYLEVLQDLASAPDAPAQMKADFQTLIDWFKETAKSGSVESDIRKELTATIDRINKETTRSLEERLNKAKAALDEARESGTTKDEQRAEKRVADAQRDLALADKTASTRTEKYRKALEALSPEYLQSFLSDFGASFADQDIRLILARSFHEQFARAHEAYLMEGKAPSDELRSVFARFKDWLKLIYKQLVNLNVELTDEVRSVLDRIYASDAEIEAAKKAVPTEPMFTTAKDAGLTDLEFEAYNKALGKQAETAREALLEKLMAEKARETKEWWKKAKADMTAQVTAEVDALPVYRAFAALSAGKLEDGTPIKLNAQALKNRYDIEYSKRIPTRLKTKTGGMDPDAAAAYLGYESGDKLIEDLVGMKPRKEYITAEVNDRMVKTYGDMMLDGSISDQAKTALHSQAREQVLMTELRLIARKKREVQPFVKAAMQDYKGRAKAALDVPPVEFFRETAKAVMDKTLVKDIVPYSYLRAQQKASKQAISAMAKGDFETAQKAKERELLNHHLYLEAVKAKEDSDKILDYARKFDTRATRERIGKAGGDYLQQIDAILDRYEFRRIPLSQLQKRRALLDWVNEQEAQGEEPAIDERILDEARQVNYREVPISELRAVRDAVKNIEHIARFKNKLIANNKYMEFKDAVEELTAAAALNGKGLARPIDPSLTSPGKEFADKVRSIDATLLKMEQLVRWLDGGDVNGPWHTYLWNPIAEAQFKEYDLQKQIGKKITESFEKMPKEQRVSMLDTYDVPGIGKVTKKFIMSMAFNMGNQENIDKMMAGHGWSMTVIEGALQHLTREDWVFVQETWDTISSLWPQIAELEKRMTGLEPTKVTPQPYTARLKNGLSTIELRGGYFPLKYDPNYSEQGAKQEAGNLGQMFEQGYVRATTSKGHTKARTQFAAPLLMDFEQIITGHLTQVIKDLTHREAIVSANKIITNKEIRGALQAALGVEYERQFMPWLRSVVNDRNTSSIQGAGAATKLMMQVRANVIAATMGYSVTTALTQLVGFSASLDMVKAKYLGQAIIDYLKHPVKVRNEINELSGEIRNLEQSRDRDIRAVFQHFTTDQKVIGKVQEMAFHGIALADAMVKIPTWLGAYRQAIAEGKSKEVAIREGDAAVRMTQGSGAAKDLSAIQRNNEFWKTMTMFYSYFNVLYNRMRDMGHEVQEIRDMPKFLARAMFTVMIPAVMGDLLVGRGPDDDEDELLWIIRKMLLYPTLSIPIIRDITSSLESGYDYRFSPIATGFEKIGGLAKSTGKLYEGDMEWGDYCIKATDTIGFAVGVPGTTQATRTAKYLWRVEQGDENPDNIMELIGHAAVGKKPEK